MVKIPCYHPKINNNNIFTLAGTLTGVKAGVKGDIRCKVLAALSTVK